MRFISFVALLLSLTAAAANAQTIGPITFTFTASDADVAKTLSYHLDFYQCASVAAGVGVGCATTPFQAGVDIPKSSITSSGTTRTGSLTTPPANGLLSAVPAGVPFVGTLVANGDPAQGAGNSAKSAVSNPFFGAALPVNAPTGLRFP